MHLLDPDRDGLRGEGPGGGVATAERQSESYNRSAAEPAQAAPQESDTARQQIDPERRHTEKHGMNSDGSTGLNRIVSLYMCGQSAESTENDTVQYRP
jgi:hypothetical protein